MTPSEIMALRPFHLANPCSPGIVTTDDPTWSEYFAIESDRTGEVVVEAVHQDTAEAVLRILNEGCL